MRPEVLPVLWGRQFCLQPPFRRLYGGRARVFDHGKRRLKAGGSQDWLPHSDARIDPSGDREGAIFAQDESVFMKRST
jgi:hypothetical protein